LDMRLRRFLITEPMLSLLAGRREMRVAEPIHRPGSGRKVAAQVTPDRNCDQRPTRSSHPASK
jgi:hypothetical protein